MYRYVGKLKLMIDTKRSVRGFELCQELALLRNPEDKDIRKQIREKYNNKIFSDENLELWEVTYIRAMVEGIFNMLRDDYELPKTEWEGILPRYIAAHDMLEINISYGSNEETFVYDIVNFFKPYLIENHENILGTQEDWLEEEPELILLRGPFDTSYCKYCEYKNCNTCNHYKRCENLHNIPCTYKEIKVGDILWKANEIGLFGKEIKAIVELKDGKYFSFDEDFLKKETLIPMERIGEMYFESVKLIPENQLKDAEIFYRNRDHG